VPAWPRLVWLLLAAAVLAGAGLAVRAEVAGAWVVVRDEQGRTVASARLPRSGRFALEYRHSVYGAEATETFAAGADGEFRMISVTSASEAVLDYYAVEGRRQADGGRLRLEPRQPARLRALPLVATEVGRRTLVVGSTRVPLYASGQGPVRLVLTVRRSVLPPGLAGAASPWRPGRPGRG
jgi:hypothetical protein